MKALQKEKPGSGRRLFLIIIAGLIILALFNPVSVSLFKETGLLREQLLLKQSEKAELTALVAEADPIRAEWELLAAEKERLETMVPLEKELPFALVELEKTIKSFPLELRRLQAGEKRFLDNHGLLVVELSIAGPPAAAEAFLGRLTTLPHFLVFDSLTWAYSAEGEVLLDLELELLFVDPDQLEPLPGPPDPERQDL